MSALPFHKSGINTVHEDLKAHIVWLETIMKLQAVNDVQKVCYDSSFNNAACVHETIIIYKKYPHNSKLSRE